MSLSSSRFAGFTGVRRMGRRDHPGSLGSLGFDMVFILGCALVVVGYIQFTGVCPRSRLVHPGSLGSPVCVLCVVGFIPGRWFYWGSPRVSSGSSGVVFFSGVRPWGVGIIRVGWVHLDASLVSSRSSGFSGVRPGSPRV